VCGCISELGFKDCFEFGTHYFDLRTALGSSLLSEASSLLAAGGIEAGAAALPSYFCTTAVERRLSKITIPVTVVAPALLCVVETATSESHSHAFTALMTGLLFGFLVLPASLTEDTSFFPAQLSNSC